MYSTKRTRPSLGVTALVIVALVLTGCAASATPADPVSADAAVDSGDPVEGGTIRLRSAYNNNSLDPNQASSIAQSIGLRGLVDSLLFHRPDGTFEGWLAESWEVNEDATEYVFHLRDGITFSNGETFDAEAVKLAFDAIRAAEANYATANTFIGDLDEVAVDDDLTVRFSFNSGNSAFLQAVSTVTLGIVAPETSALSFDERQTGTEIYGTGPFVAAENRNEEGYLLEKRDDYAWAPPSSILDDRAAYVDAVEVIYVAENSLAASQLVAGDLDVIQSINADDKTRLHEHADTYIVPDPISGASLGFYVNEEHPALEDVRVRRALQFATDNEELVASASVIDLVPTDAFTRTNPYWTDHSHLIQYDPDEAAELLDEAGWELGDDGFRHKDGEKLSLELIYGTSGAPHESQYALLQARWAEQGIELRLSRLTVAEVNQRVLEGDYAFTWGGGSRPDADVLRANAWGQDAELDSLLEQILVTTDEVERSEIAAAAAERYITQGLRVYFYDFISPPAWRTALQVPTVGQDQLPLFSDAWFVD